MMQRLKKILSPYSRLFLFAGIFAIFFLWSYSTLDPDFGWHLRSGQYFLEHGIPQYDIFTYTASNFHWVNHEWLSDIILSVVYGVGSFELVAVLHAVMWTVAVAILGRGVHPALIVSAVVAVLPFAGVRALTWSVLCLALLVLILRQKNTRWRLSIPLLFLVWVNFHGSFLIGIAYGGWKVISEKSWKLAVIGCVSFGMTLINPYGIEIYTEIFRTMLDSELHLTIVEWARWALPISAVPYVLTWLGLTIYHNQRRWKQYVRFETLLFVMSVASMRMTPLFALMSLRGLQETIQEIDESLPKKYRPERVRVGKIAAVLLVVVSLTLPIAESASGTLNPTRYPVAAVQHLRENPCEGNIFNAYNFGGFLIWQLPEKKVYIDGRMPSWGHEDGMYIKDYLRILDDTEFRDEQFARYDIQCVLMENDVPMTTQLIAEGWIVKIDDGYSSLLVSKSTN